jgi:hypothetical protein
MGALFAVAGLLFSLTAQAVPTPALQRLIDRTVDKNITYFHSVEKQSIRECPQGRTFVVGKEPWTLTNRTMTLDEYEAPGSTRAVIIMPPTGGENVIDQYYANLLCSKGIRAVIVSSFELFPEDGIDLKMYDTEALRSLAAIRQTAEYLQRTGAKSIGLLGTSLGAIQGAFGVMADDRINTATLIVGGLGLAQIASASQEPEQAELRQARMEMWKLNQAQYAEKMRLAIHVDAFAYEGDPTLATRKKVLSIVALDDSYVPTANQMRLYHVWGDQQLITMKREHVSTVMRSALMHAMEIFDFFDANMAK